MCLYTPLFCAAGLAFWLKPNRRFLVGILFATAWVAALLPWLDNSAQLAGLWSYHTPGPHLAGMPLALYIGWVIAWGIFAPLLAASLGNRMILTVGILVWIDFLAMKEMRPVLQLQSRWWIGELLVSVVLLVPALWLARWTEYREKTPWRCGLLVPAFGGIFLGIPLLWEFGGIDKLLEKWDSLSAVSRFFYLTSGALFTLPGLVAVRDLALSGKGTPVPLDPPQLLVTHGIYAFVRNPMQISMTALLLLVGLFSWSLWPVVLAVAGGVYAAGFASWSENEGMKERFGTAWASYHASHRPWLPRWRPIVGDRCELWLDQRCGPCAEIARWFHKRSPEMLDLCDTHTWTGAPLSRVTWHHPASGRKEQGVVAIAMALQHLHFGWAMLGWVASLPGISHAFQVCMDAVGAGRKP